MSAPTAMMQTTAGVLCVVVSVVSLVCVAGCNRPAPEIRLDTVDVSLVAQKRSWNASYLVARSPGQALEVPTGREVHVPVGALVRLKLASEDFVSDFRLDGFELRDFAAPGLPSEFLFHAYRPGRFEVRGEELCGLPHTDRTRGWLVVEDVAG